jgi:hypothetical protein
MNSAYLDTFNDYTNQVLDTVITNHQPIRLALALSLMLYGSLAAPIFPTKYLFLVDNIYFRIAFIAFIAWTTSHDPLLGVATAVLFIIVLDKVLSHKNNIESFSSGRSYEGMGSAIYPGCLNMTVADLLESFGNDKEQLLNAMMVSRVPGDVIVNDYYAPLIGTYLINYGFGLKSPCSFPQVNENIGY